jgi:hypothetical protein
VAGVALQRPCGNASVTMALVTMTTWDDLTCSELRQGARHG